MAANIKVVRERRRLNTDMNVPPVDQNLYVRTTRSRNTPYDVRQRQLNNQNNRGEKLNIPPRQSSLQRDCKVATDISREPQRDREMPMYNTFQQVFTSTLTL